MPRPPDPAVRTALVEQAAAMLVAREPVTLRALATRAGTSTMAVYTHFDGIAGLWAAVRQEGFGRLAARLADVAPTDDPVRDLAALGAAYAAHALTHPALYRAMFDAAADLPDPEAAGAAFTVLVDTAARARDAGRIDADPLAVATRQWAAGHGLILLVISDVLPRAALAEHAPPIITAIVAAAGDDPARCAASVRAGWSG
ncbi:TetR/AcrR family transcriptional regulator [Actinomycetospora straminea]|uniref:TetR/AcrR family transcriptional regulator n=1 Tax=Actinomycetospora straminea TaxID=663607 RepID=A0ABP9EI15_9PSEU|nr:TetR/AcrR family transcriptional regulator [Actinomycetospora straminea]MDD7934389.1 TetR/AcrR family transcriptional regulator [Actinomycetospora straminea]